MLYPQSPSPPPPPPPPPPHNPSTDYSSFLVHSQPTYLYRNYLSHDLPTPALPTMPPQQLAYFPPPPQFAPPPFTHPPVPAPPPALHKVWILDCKSCGTFLTNRSMKAVLLLRPNVPLYSTDAMPVNCSAVTISPPANASRASSTRSHRAAHDRDEPPRTCECLTQTLSCHGCGAQVGYMIVVPCMRCTSSVFPPQGFHHSRARSTNGHRFVFHSSEVVAEERLYVQNEAGVDPEAQPESFEISDSSYQIIRGMPGPSPMALMMHPASALSPGSGSRTQSSLGYSMNFQNGQLDPRIHQPSPPTDGFVVTATHAPSTLSSRGNSTPAGHEHRRVSSSPGYWVESDSDMHAARHESSPPRDGETREHAQRHTGNPRGSRHRQTSSISHASSPVTDARSSPMRSRYRERELRSPPPLSRSAHIASPPPPPPSHPEPPRSKIKRLRPGDVVYWHHLSRRGELPGVCDDERARASRGYGGEIASVTSHKRGSSRRATTIGEGEDSDGDTIFKAEEASDWDSASSSSSSADRSYRGMAVGARMWCAR